MKGSELGAEGMLRTRGRSVWVACLLQTVRLKSVCRAMYSRRGYRPERRRSVLRLLTAKETPLPRGFAKHPSYPLMAPYLLPEGEIRSQ